MTAKDVVNFVQGNLNYKLGAEPYIKEQAVFRSILCYDCLLNNKCLSCGCHTPNLFYAPGKIDSRHRFDKMLSSPEWEEYKKTDEYKNAMAFADQVLPGVTQLPSKDDIQRGFDLSQVTDNIDTYYQECNLILHKLLSEANTSDQKFVLIKTEDKYSISIANDFLLFNDDLLTRAYSFGIHCTESVPSGTITFSLDPLKYDRSNRSN